jgi:hypothetical protein
MPLNLPEALQRVTQLGFDFPATFALGVGTPQFLIPSFPRHQSDFGRGKDFSRLAEGINQHRFVNVARGSRIRSLEPRLMQPSEALNHNTIG